ncbi:MAG: response regulator [Desulfobacterales bacterium]|nr:response regulator [Desulfobacterales bacterium]
MTGLGGHQVIGKTVMEVLPATESAWIDTYGQVAITCEPASFENYSRELDRHFTVTAYCPEKGQFACIFQDITERKQAEEEKRTLQERLQQAQKMEAIGTLAGGIAHDFNNILGAIIGYGEMMEIFDLAEESDLRENLTEMIRAAYRAKDLVGHILTFSRQTEIEKTAVDLSPMVKEILKLIRATIPSTIDIVSEIRAKNDTIFADPAQMHQVVMNLCTNAAHAMREAGGTLTVSLSEEKITGNTAIGEGTPPSGPHVRLCVRDTGTGIAEEHLGRIFDPYFTTKKQGEGTGLGLSVIHGIVTALGGHITVDSQPGMGSTFTVLLPSLLQPKKVPAETSANAPLPRGHGCILLVDDEPALVNVGSKMMTRLGYEVVSHTSSRDALEAFQQDPGRFDLVITDQTMPAMTGMELARAIMGVRPDQPVIICTGYSETVSKETARAVGIRDFLYKPMSTRQIAETLHRVLSDKPSIEEGNR